MKDLTDQYEQEAERLAHGKGSGQYGEWCPFPHTDHDRHLCTLVPDIAAALRRVAEEAQNRCIEIIEHRLRLECEGQMRPPYLANLLHGLISRIRE